MVGVLDVGPGGARGKLSGDPAITTAAVALLNGWSDPLDLLSLDDDDYAIAVAVISEAEQLRAKRDKHFADYAAAKTANSLLPGLVKAIKRMLGQLFRG